MVITSSGLSRIGGIRHGFGTHIQPLPANFQRDWEQNRPRWQQVHGTAVGIVGTPGQPCGEVDALITSAPGIPIGIMTADCVPVLLSRNDGGLVAAVHAGWRGLKARILPRVWEQLAAAGGGDPAQWTAAVGPAIGPCCYEVSEELAASFRTEFASYGPDLAVPRFRYLDLPALALAELKSLGLGSCELIRACTRCSRRGDLPGEFRFHSYRREGGGTRQWSVIGILEGTPAT